MKKLLAAWLALLMLTALSLAEEPETYTCGVWEYTLTEEGAVITWWDWYEIEYQLPERVVLPAELDGHPVIGIGPNALNTFEIDSDVCFTLVVPEGITALSENAFMCCHNALVIQLPSTLTEIPENAFHHVWADIYVAQGNPRYTMQDGFLIDQQTSTLLYTTPSEDDQPIPAVRRLGSGSMENYIGEWGQDIIIPEGVEEIGSYAFYDWEYGHVTLPESLRLIESMAFEVGIIEPVIVPAGVEFVEHWAFSGCGSEVEVIAGGDATHFETAEEYEARTGYRHWMDDWQ